MARAVGVHVDAHGLRHADGVGELHQALLGDARGHEVLGQIACGVGRAAVHLRRVLAGEGAAAVGAAPAVGVHDDLAAGQAGVAGGAADHEFPGGVDVEDGRAVEEFRGALGQGLDEAGEDDLTHVLLYFRAHTRVVGVELVVLRAQDDGVHAHGGAAAGEFDGELGLGVRAEVGHQLRLVVPDVGERLQELVRERQGEGHVFLGVRAGVAEHHALVAGALLLGLLAGHAAVDVGALLVDGGDDAAGSGVETVLGLVVADALDHAARRGRDVDVGALGIDLAAHDHQAGGAEGFTGDVRLRVLPEEFVENGI